MFLLFWFLRENKVDLMVLIIIFKVVVNEIFIFLMWIIKILYFYFVVNLLLVVYELEIFVVNYVKEYLNMSSVVMFLRMVNMKYFGK